ncbi:MAG: XisH family protein [Acidobacteria bacterium]|nr:XisH family protein [Acidobacteriota bacterium]
MAQLDKIHNAVKNALIKDGWTITSDPYRIEFEEYRLYADMAAERPIAARKGNEKIVVEVKSFIGRSTVTDFENALGQYRLYRRLLLVTEPETKLYLAVSEATYSDFFVLEATQFIIRTEEVSLFTVNLEKEVIERWINH